MQQKCHLIFPLCGCKAPEPKVEVLPEPQGSLIDEPVEVDEELLAKLAEVEELRRKIQRTKQRKSFPAFFQAAWAAQNPGTVLEWGPHIQAVCEHVQWQLEDRARAKEDPTFKVRAQDLVINVPPRSLKTMILTYATIWAWLRWPAMRIMYLSANPRVALNSARQARDLVISHWFQTVHKPAWTIRTDQNALSDLGNTAGGARIARGLDSTITGEGCEWLIIDDPHDLRDSIENIEKVIEGYDSAVHNRVNDPRASIRTCIMQRVNILDFTAHILKKGWIHVRIPMEYEVKPMCDCPTCQAGVNPYGWKDWRVIEGEVLHPRFTPEFLEKEKLRLGSFGYAAQMQQRPAVAGGGRIKKEFWGFCRLSGYHAGDHPRPAGCREGDEPRVIEKIKSGWNRGKWDLDWLVLTVDAANKKTERGSAYGLLAVGGKDMRRFILDDRTRRGEFTEIVQVLREMIVAWKPDKLLVEAKAAGPALMSSLQKEMEDGKLRYHEPCNALTFEIETLERDVKGRQVSKFTRHCPRCQKEVEGTPIVVPIEPIEVDLDKERRVDAVLPQIEARLCYILEGAAWAGEFVEEHALFPESPWNDRVDSLSQVLEYYKDGPFYVL